VVWKVVDHSDNRMRTEASVSVHTTHVKC
jgi:hypothetical protein